MLMDEKQAAEILCFSVRTLQKWRQEGAGPEYIKVNGRSVRYRPEDIEAWLLTQRPHGEPENES